MIEHAAPHAPLTLHPVPPTPERLFEDWLLERQPSLTAHAARPYRSIWRSWCAWLADHPDPAAPTTPRSYPHASASDLAAFLSTGLAPRSGRRRAAGHPPSDITRRRYWRVIDNLYRYAQARSLLTHNPATGIALHERPTPEKPEGYVFDDAQWRALADGLPAPTSVWALRDRALVLLIMDAALTNAETCALRLQDVTPVPGTTTLALHLSGPRRAQRRRLVLGEAASCALTDWLAARHTLRPHSAEHAPRLFLTERRRGLSARTLFPVVVNTVKTGFAAHALAVPAHLQSHLGPQVLRNTRLVHWLNGGQPLATVLERAGLKNAHSLASLRHHLHDEVRQRLAGSTRTGPST